MVAMETGHFLKMLNDASLASLGFLMWKVLGCIICKKKHCGYSRARLDQKSLFGCRTTRQVQEKCREQNLDLYMVFVDLTKAFDTISKDGLWQILRNIGCPDLFVYIIWSFHEGMVARVQDQGQTSEPFSVTNGTKQGCVVGNFRGQNVIVTSGFKEYLWNADTLSDYTNILGKAG